MSHFRAQRVAKKGTLRKVKYLIVYLTHFWRIRAIAPCKNKRCVDRIAGFSLKPANIRNKGRGLGRTVYLTGQGKKFKLSDKLSTRRIACMTMSFVTVNGMFSISGVAIVSAAMTCSSSSVSATI